MTSTNRAGHPWDKPGHDYVDGSQTMQIGITRPNYSSSLGGLPSIRRPSTAMATRSART